MEGCPGKTPSIKKQVLHLIKIQQKFLVLKLYIITLGYLGYWNFLAVIIINLIAAYQIGEKVFYALQSWSMADSLQCTISSNVACKSLF